jgi:aminocarboxymuconate-semialdehyde decarboxylase
LAELVGIDRIMLGTDYSFPPADLTPMHTLRQAGFAAQEIEQIAGQNPRRVFHIDRMI